MNVSRALKEIFKQDFSRFTENIYLKDSFGRTLSKPVSINKSIPEFDTSSMDGFAVKKSSLGKIGKFTVLGETPAGAKSCYMIKPNECVRVYTGSRMPKNADFVVIQENTWSQGNFMYVNDYDKKSSYVRKTGLDFKKGQIISNPMFIDFYTTNFFHFFIGFFIAKLHTIIGIFKTLRPLVWRHAFSSIH